MTDLTTAPALTFDVPTEHAELLAKKISQFARRAVKLGMLPARGAEAALFTVGPVQRTEHVTTLPSGKQITIVREFTTVTPHLPSVALSGWALLAVVEPLGAEALLRVVPGHEVPAAVRNGLAARVSYCDHCQSSRRRSLTYLVQHTDGTVKQVGRNCLRDFLGHDPARMLQMLTFVASIEACFGDEESWGWGRVPMTFTVRDIITLAVFMARVKGFRTKAAADAYRIASGGEGHVMSTADDVRWFVSPCITPNDHKEMAAFIAAHGTPTADDAAQAERIHDWAMTAFTARASDFEYNLDIIVRADAVRMTKIALVTAIVGSWLRKETKDAERAAEAKIIAPDWTPGRQVVTGTVMTRQKRETEFGTVIKLLVRCDDGKKLWVSEPSAICTEIKDVVTMTVTVEPKEGEASFAFGSRPGKASVAARA